LSKHYWRPSELCQNIIGNLLNFVKTLLETF
jgi:hypothetical protein